MLIFFFNNKLYRKLINKFQVERSLLILSLKRQAKKMMSSKNQKKRDTVKMKADILIAT